MHEESVVTIGIDVGGTKLCAAAVDSAGRVIAFERRPAPLQGYEAALAAIAGACTAVRRQAGAEVTAAGVATAAFFARDRASVRYSTNLGWRGGALRADLEERLGLPVAVENDADAAAWGEYVHGAAQGEDCAVMATLGTGIGGGAVIGGRLLTGGHGLGAELGHLQVVPDGLPCGCGARGCLEQYASGTALARIARERAQAEPRRTRLPAGAPEQIDGRLVIRLARAGDAVARQALDEISGWVGRGLAMVASILDPTAVILGGGLAEAAPDLLLEPIGAAIERHTTIPGARPAVPVRIGALGNRAGAIGAAALAREVPAVVGAR
jgi:glucokinase